MRTIQLSLYKPGDLIYVSDNKGVVIYIYRVQGDGSLEMVTEDNQ